MKRHHPFHQPGILTAMLAPFAFCNTEIAQAQDTTFIQIPMQSEISKPSSIEKPAHRFNKNTFKVNVTSLGLKNYHFTYERMLARKFSAAVSYRTMPSSPLSDLKMVKTGLEVMGEDGAGGTIEGLRQINASNKAITLELRMYKGSKPGAKGFYTGLFGRYGDFNVGYDYTYVDGNSKSYPISIKANATSLSGGLQLGAQFNIFKHISVDLQLLGLHFGNIKGDAIGNANLSAMSAEDQQGLEIRNRGPVTLCKGEEVIPY